MARKTLEECKTYRYPPKVCPNPLCKAKVSGFLGWRDYKTAGINYEKGWYIEDTMLQYAPSICCPACSMGFKLAVVHPVDAEIERLLGRG